MQLITIQLYKSIMLSIKLGSQLKNEALYIHSINQTFENKIDKYQLKRFKTSPERSKFQISPKITKVLGRAEIITPQRSALLAQNISTKLAQIKNSLSEERPKKRWNSIQKEQYNHIKNQININKLQTPNLPTIKHRFASIQLLNKVQLPHSLKTPQVISPFYEMRQKWFSDRLKHQFKSAFVKQLAEKEKDTHSQSIQSDQQSNKPFNFSLKLPKLHRKSQGENVRLQTLQIDEQPDEEESIFCSRKIKKSLRKLNCQKMGDLSQQSKLGQLSMAVKRRRVKTIDYQHAPQTLLAPWNVANSVTKSPFY